MAFLPYSCSITHPHEGYDGFEVCRSNHHCSNVPCLRNHAINECTIRRHSLCYPPRACALEDQAFSPSYDLAPSPPHPSSSVSKFSLFLGLPCVSPFELTDGRVGGREKELNHTTARKPGPLEYLKYSLGCIKYSLLQPFCIFSLSQFRGRLLHD
jgi:hypothetical protein